MSKRRAVLADALKDAGITHSFNAVLDHGGDRGQMLQDIPAKLKAVFEISGVQTDYGIEAISKDNMRSTNWDLILSCHVLEHLTFPSAYVKDLVSLGGTGTVFFIEIPDELFKSFNFNGTTIQKRWISWIVKQPRMFMLFDFFQRRSGQSYV